MLRDLFITLLLLLPLCAGAQETTGFNEKFAAAINASDTTLHHRLELFTKAIDSFETEGDELDIPNYGAALFNRSQLYLEDDQDQKAIQDLTDYIAYAPDDDSGYLKRGTTYFELGLFDLARKDFDLIIDRYQPQKELFKGNVIADTYNNRAVLNLRTERWEEACKDLQLAYDHGRTSLKEYIKENCQ